VCTCVIQREPFARVRSKKLRCLRRVLLRHEHATAIEVAGGFGRSSRCTVAQRNEGLLGGDTADTPLPVRCAISIYTVCTLHLSYILDVSYIKEVGMEVRLCGYTSASALRPGTTPTLHKRRPPAPAQPRHSSATPPCQGSDRFNNNNPRH
jgi:hypothetical protein